VECGEEVEGNRCYFNNNNNNNNNNSSYCLERKSPSIKTSGICLPDFSSFSLFCLLAPLVSA
jgi:hypothetical protein